MNYTRFVKLVIRGFGVYLLYNVVLATRKEYKLDQARIIQEQQIRYGSHITLSKEKQAIVDEASKYLDDHAGHRYLNRMRTEQFFGQQFKKLIKQKEQSLAATSPDDKQTINKLISQIRQLKEAELSIIPKMPNSWQDLGDKEQQDE